MISVIIITFESTTPVKCRSQYSIIMYNVHVIIKINLYHCSLLGFQLKTKPVDLVLKGMAFIQ